MKRIIGIIICLTLIVSALAFTGCGTKKDLKLGLGVTTTVTASSAEDKTNGIGQATTTAAAVLVDDEGKIVKAFIDCADNKVEYDANGKAIKNDSFKTKYEQGADYNMKAYGGAAKEWYEQADAFCALIVGKTAAEVKALVASDYKGTQEVIDAGCTIYISDFATAVDKAMANAVATTATEKDSIKLGVSTTQTAKDATADAAGSQEVATTFFAAAVDADGKVVAATSDCVSVTFTFDEKGASTFDTKKAVSSKKELGDDYNMKAYGGAAKEWYEQAAAFDAACAGKTVAEIKALEVNGKGNADLQAAGCTIYISEFVKAVAKIG